MKQRNPLSVVHMKSFLLVAIGGQPKPPVSQDAIAIHQKDLDAPCPAFDFVSFEF
jgi:hypothetical protein